jgi:hypothetical protein
MGLTACAVKWFVVTVIYELLADNVAVINPTFFIEFPQAWVSSEKKPPFPKLLNALRNGLNGSPAIAYPSMLALLANLSNEVRLIDAWRLNVQAMTVS